MNNEVMNYEPQGQNKSVGTDIAITRQAQEVQAAMVVAKKFPRDIISAEKRIMDSCKRISLAEEAIYSYPRGTSKVEGPSIRLAEVIAQNYGNIDTGLIELERSNGESAVMAYAWDLESNFRDTKVFTVAHRRDTKKGGYELTEERDIYELIANMGARRKRACMLAVVPGDIVEKAVEQCRKTMAGQNTEPLHDRLIAIFEYFEKSFGVKKEQIEEYFSYKADSFSEYDVVKLRGIVKSIKDGMAKPEDYFGEAPKKKISLDDPKDEPKEETPKKKVEPKQEAKSEKETPKKQSKQKDNQQESIELDLSDTPFADVEPY